MRGKLVSAAIAFVLVLGLASAVFGDLSVGVKKGDWIEYAVTYTGLPNQGHGIIWAHMEVTDLQGTNIIVSIDSRYPNGSTELFNSTLNLKSGKLIDDYIIPANLHADDTFLDQNLGNVTISRSEQKTYSGATRTVLYGATSQNTYIWDQATGVTVEGKSQQPDYTMHTIVVDTNMWQSSEDLNIETLIVVAVLAMVVIVTIVLSAFRYRKRKTP